MAGYYDKDKIGSGGYSEVYRCTRDTDGSEFAKKTLVDLSDESINRFRKEVRILSSLDHPNIIKVIGKRLQNPPYFYIMPIYEHSLRDIISELQYEKDRVIKIFNSIIDAMEYAHSQGIMHRDLKPENILMNSDDDIVISDFGLGRKIDSTSTRDTRTGEQLGTMQYMSPEHFDGKTCDFQTDIYVLGIILYEVILGHLPTGLTSPLEIPDPGMRAIIVKCMQKELKTRYQTVKELKRDWHSLSDASVEQSDMEEYSVLKLKENKTDVDKKLLFELFLNLFRDPDNIHDALIKMNPITVFEMAMTDVDTFIGIISQFVEFTIGQAWGFSYTDKIADWCWDVFKVVNISEIKIKLIKCVLVVGVDHNRWHVLDVLKKMLSSKIEPGEVIMLDHELKSIRNITVISAGNYIDYHKLPKNISKIFQDRIDEEEAKKEEVDFW